MLGYSVYGTGIRTMGYEPEPPDAVILTSWVTLLFVPIIPIGRKKCRYISESPPLGHLDGAPHFEVLEELPLSITSVITTYLGAMVALIVTLAPAGYVICRIQGRAIMFFELALIMLCAAWPGVFVGLKERRDLQLLQSTWTPQRSNLHTIMQLASKANEEAIWQMKHVVPARLYVVIAVVGFVPGAALAQWNGWVPNGMKMAAVVSSATCLGFTFAIDRLLVRFRNAQNGLTSKITTM